MSTNNSALISSLKNAFNIKFSDEIDEFVLRGIWKRNQYNTLYLLDMFSKFNSIDKSRFEGIIDDYFSKHKLRINNSIQLYVDNKSNNNSNITSVNGPIYPDSYPICGNACMDCCEDVCEHAICCNCTASIVSHWFEEMDVDNGNVVNPVAGNEYDIENSNMYKLQERAFKHIQKAKKICCFFTLIILLILIAIGMVLFYYLYYKPNYIQ
mmetsp:Transcript_42863/g.52702  ORF Transcript_42863/g.52702 Transcript_42863/m.52702 type:complete len:210 (+) Transcript_42863:78-707(+)